MQARSQTSKKHYGRLTAETVVFDGTVDGLVVLVTKAMLNS
jgi:hypothetical protein